MWADASCWPATCISRVRPIGALNAAIGGPNGDAYVVRQIQYGSPLGWLIEAVHSVPAAMAAITALAGASLKIVETAAALPERISARKAHYRALKAEAEDKERRFSGRDVNSADHQALREAIRHLDEHLRRIDRQEHLVKKNRSAAVAAAQYAEIADICEKFAAVAGRSLELPPAPSTPHPPIVDIIWGDVDRLAILSREIADRLIKNDLTGYPNVRRRPKGPGSSKKGGHDIDL